MKNQLKWTALTAMAALALTGTAQAQMATGFAPTEAMDTLSGGSVGGGPSTSTYVNRARDVAANPFASTSDLSNPGANPFGAPAPGDPFGAPAPGVNPGFGGAADSFGGAADPFGGGFAAPGTTAFPQPGASGGFQIPKVNAIYGDRVICAVTGQMLEDAYEVPILQTFTSDYYDDGENGMDYQANDNKYTNVRLVEDQMSPEAHLVKTRLIQGLVTLETMNPREFAMVPVASSDPLAGVPHMLELEAERDDRLAAWASRFLRDFRTNPDEAGNWEFHPTYMPAPPFPPFSLLPSNFYPPFLPDAGKDPNEAATQGTPSDGFGRNPGASSAYF